MVTIELVRSKGNFPDSVAAAIFKKDPDCKTVDKRCRIRTLGGIVDRSFLGYPIDRLIGKQLGLITAFDPEIPDQPDRR